MTLVNRLHDAMFNVCLLVEDIDHCLANGNIDNDIYRPFSKQHDKDIAALRAEMLQLEYNESFEYDSELHGTYKSLIKCLYTAQQRLNDYVTSRGSVECKKSVRTADILKKVESAIYNY